MSVLCDEDSRGCGVCLFVRREGEGCTQEEEGVDTHVELEDIQLVARVSVPKEAQDKGSDHRGVEQEDTRY